MDSTLISILSVLPSIEKIIVRAEPDYYGMSRIVAKKNKLTFVPRSISGWKHGWIFTDVKYLEQITNGDSYSNYLVSSIEHENILREKGLKAKAVGAPFVYVEDVETLDIERKKNTLLVMPPHSLPYTNHVWDEESYAKKIDNLRSKFDLIVVCLHQSCIEKGLWVNAFKKYDIPWIIGADAQDKNSLIRMYRIFKSFEFMTTNIIGSHVPYAAYCGCKVSIYGSYVEYNREDLCDSPIYQKYPFLLDFLLRNSSFDVINRNYHFLFNTPEKAEINIQWAEEQLGKSNKVTFKELARLLGWTIYDQALFFTKKGYSKIVNKFLRTRDFSK